MLNSTQNKYVDFIADKDFMQCIENLFTTYEKTKKEYTEKKFYKGRIDPIKLTFDMKFNDLSEEEMVSLEIKRQIDRNISNFIGHFHEELLGNIDGYEHKRAAGYDIRKEDDTLFAEIKNKQNTVNSSSKENTYQKLQRFAIEHPGAKCYWVALIANNSYCEQWTQTFNNRKYSHPNVYKISGDKFYEVVTGDENAFAKLCAAIPMAIDDFLIKNDITLAADNSILYDIISDKASINGVTLTKQLYNDNFNKYNGFPIN